MADEPQPVTLRQATVDDVPLLLELWSDLLRRAERQEQVPDLELIVKEAAESAERRLLVAEYDGEPAGAVLLRVTPMTPLNLEPTVQALAPHVLPSYRGKGIGSALMEAAVVWAEDLGIGHVTTARRGLAQRQPVHGPALPRARRPSCASRPRSCPRQAGRAAAASPVPRAGRRPPPARPGPGRAPPAHPAHQRGHRRRLPA